MAYVADEDARAVHTLDVDAHAELASTFVGGAPGPMLLLPDGRLAVGIMDSAVVLLLEPRPGEWSLRPGDAFLETAPEPRGLALSPDAKTLWVATGWGHTLSGFRVSDRTRTFEVDLPRDPRSVVAAGDGRHLYVSHAVGGRASVVELEGDRARVRSVALRGRSRLTMDQLAAERGDVEAAERVAAAGATPPNASRRPEGGFEAARGDDASRARRAMLEKSLASGTPTCQHFALAMALDGRVLLPGVSVDPGGEDVLDPEKRGTTAETYGNGGPPAEIESIAVLDPVTGEASPASLDRVDTGFRGEGVPECLLPRAATVDEASKALLVACQGSNVLVAYDTTAMTPAEHVLGRWRLGDGPNGIALDAARHEAVVWSQFDRTLAIVKLDVVDEARAAEKRRRSVENPCPDCQRSAAPWRPTARIALTPLDRGHEAEQLGRTLFNATFDGRISSDGRACASCHPDGRDDAIVWATPNGPRRSIALAGRLDSSGPFSWQGSAPTVKAHVQTTFKRLRGTGLDGIELDALVAYVKSLGQPGHKGRPNQDQIDQGDRLFHAPRTGCSTCHSGAAFTDGKKHDVGSGRAFDTPSLLGVGAAGPFFHDGRYTDLATLLEKTDGKMGRTAHLGADERAALLAYLKSL